MGFYKHGQYSFSIAVQKMSAIGGDSFVADVTSLRRHTHTGAATTLDVPVVVEQYGETAQDAQFKAIKVMCSWLDRNAALLAPDPTGERPLDGDAVTSA